MSLYYCNKYREFFLSITCSLRESKQADDSFLSRSRAIQYCRNKIQKFITLRAATDRQFSSILLSIRQSLYRQYSNIFQDSRRTSLLSENNFLFIEFQKRYLVV